MKARAAPIIIESTVVEPIDVSVYEAARASRASSPGEELRAVSFELTAAREVLARTPATLDALLRGLPDAWARVNEGPDTWSAYDVVGHLVHGERTDWIPRARIILEHGAARAFEPFDRFAQFRESAGKSLEALLDEFGALRRENLATLEALRIGPEAFAREGRHPDFGVVTMGQLLATWVVHDLGHIAQIARVMAKRYAGEVGPWAEYLPVLHSRASASR